jgi:hypothetical protein
MRDEVIVDTDAGLIPLQTPDVAAALPQFSTPGGAFVSSINGQTGAVVDGGGASGFTYSAGAGVVTLIGPLTTKGDLYTHNGVTGIRKAIGADGTVPIADSAEAVGWRWGAASGGASGDLTPQFLLMGA